VGAIGLSRYEHICGILQVGCCGRGEQRSRNKLLRVCKTAQFQDGAAPKVVGEW
jgi:hypothetical protein